MIRHVIKLWAIKNLKIIDVLMTMFCGDLKIMGNSLDWNMMPTNIRKFVRKILSIKYRYLPVIYNWKFFVHNDKEMKWQKAHRFWSIETSVSKNVLDKFRSGILAKSNACLSFKEILTFKEIKEKVIVGITFSFFILMKPV